MVRVMGQVGLTYQKRVRVKGQPIFALFQKVRVGYFLSQVGYQILIHFAISSIYTILCKIEEDPHFAQSTPKTSHVSLCIIS